MKETLIKYLIVAASVVILLWNALEVWNAPIWISVVVGVAVAAFVFVLNYTKSKVIKKISITAIATLFVFFVWLHNQQDEWTSTQVPFQVLSGKVIVFKEGDEYMLVTYKHNLVVKLTAEKFGLVRHEYKVAPEDAHYPERYVLENPNWITKCHVTTLSNSSWHQTDSGLKFMKAYDSKIIK